MARSAAKTLVVRLCDLSSGQEGDFFALLTQKEELVTRDGKPYCRVTLRDAQRVVSFPIWADSPWSEACRSEWQTGQSYKVRALYRETTYGPQLDIRKLRPTTAADEADGFQPAQLLPAGRGQPEDIFEEILLLAAGLQPVSLAEIVTRLYEAHREQLLQLPAARHRHHAYPGGFLEHTWNVTRTCRHLAELYANVYPELRPPLQVDLVIAGGLLHDLGKVQELELRPGGPVRTPAGELVGHVLLGRDLIREAAAQIDCDDELLLRLEHVVLAQLSEAETAGARPPQTLEALLVSLAVTSDIRVDHYATALRDDTTPGPFTTPRGGVRWPLYRGPSV